MYTSTIGRKFRTLVISVPSDWFRRLMTSSKLGPWGHGLDTDVAPLSKAVKWMEQLAHLQLPASTAEKLIRRVPDSVATLEKLSARSEQAKAAWEATLKQLRELIAVEDERLAWTLKSQSQATNADVLAAIFNPSVNSYKRIDATITLSPAYTGATTVSAGALVLARLPLLVFGTSDPKAGAVGSLMDIARDERLNHRVEVVAGVREQQCGDLLRQFFHRRRAAARAALGGDNRTS